MSQKASVLFEEALDIAVKITRPLTSVLCTEVTLVRDLRGRIRPILPTEPETKEGKSALKKYQADLSTELGAYGFKPESAVLFADELSESDTLFRERHLLEKSENLAIYLLDRQIIGQDWMRNKIVRTTSNPRITFFSIKGGVGRSTALVNWAWHLAEQGKTVMVFDLDLESPGVSSSLLPIDHLPDFGIVDWFVEDGVGQADAIVKEMLGTSPLAQKSSGQILVIPAYGSKTGDYLPKLARCYAELGGASPMSWAERLQRMVETFEHDRKPDVVILDSRAGLHDIAAAAVTRLTADTFLFAINTPQTWTGYSMLFQHWNKHPQVREFRQQLQIVAGMVPETGRGDYLQSCKENAWDLFGEYLYDRATADDVDAFNFNLDDDSAPHAPVPVFWHRALQEFDPSKNGIDVKTANEAYGLFMEQADQMLASAAIKEVE